MYVTVEEFVEAAAKNGFDPVIGKYVVEDEEGYVTGGCVIGQACVNLNVDFVGVDYQLNRLSANPRFNYIDLGNEIVHRNDSGQKYTTVIQWLQRFIAKYPEIRIEKLRLKRKEWKVRT